MCAVLFIFRVKKCLGMSYDLAAMDNGEGFCAVFGVVSGGYKKLSTRRKAFDKASFTSTIALFNR
jgi:hypothetical protein